MEEHSSVEGKEKVSTCSEKSFCLIGCLGEKGKKETNNLFVLFFEPETNNLVTYYFRCNERG